MNTEQQPTIEQVFGMRLKTMGSVPPVIEKAVAVNGGLLYEHLRSRAYAVPAAAATSAFRRWRTKPRCGASRLRRYSKVCTVRFAVATKVLGDSEPVFEALQKN